MANQSGWATLGNRLAGGNQLNSELAYDQGQALGARTQDALEQAKQRVMQNTALEQMDSSLQGVPGLRDTDPDGPAKRKATVALYQANKDPQTVFKGVGEAFNNDRRFMAAQAADEGNSDKAAQALYPIGTNDQVVQPVGEFQYTDRLHPSKGPQATALGDQLAGTKMDQQRAQTEAASASAAQKRDEIANPGHYHLVAPTADGAVPPGYDGSSPHPFAEMTARMIASGAQPAPAPGTRTYYTNGGESMMRRVNYLSQHPEDAQQPLSGAAPPAAAPSTAAPNATPNNPRDKNLPPDIAPQASDNQPAVAPGQKPTVVPPGTMPAAAAPKGDGIQLPTETKPTLTIGAPAFNGQLNGTMRTAANDLARKNGTGGQNDAINRVAGHLDVYKQLMEQSSNTNFIASNALKNWFLAQTGKAWPGQTAMAAQVLGTEIVKSMANAGIGTGEERTALGNYFSRNASQDGGAGAIKTAEDLLREQAVATNQRVGAAGIKDFYGKYLTESARKHLRVGEFDPANQAPPAAAVAAPAGGGGPLTFKTEAEAEAAGLKPGTKVVIGGVSGTWQ